MVFLENFVNQELYAGIGKFLFLMSQVLKDPDVIKLTRSFENQFSQYGQGNNIPPFSQGMPLNQQHFPMATGMQGSTQYPSYVSHKVHFVSSVF